MKRHIVFTLTLIVALSTTTMVTVALSGSKGGLEFSTALPAVVGGTGIDALYPTGYTRYTDRVRGQEVFQGIMVGGQQVLILLKPAVPDNQADLDALQAAPEFAQACLEVSFAGVSVHVPMAPLVPGVFYIMAPASLPQNVPMTFTVHGFEDEDVAPVPSDSDWSMSQTITLS